MNYVCVHRPGENGYFITSFKIKGVFLWTVAAHKKILQPFRSGFWRLFNNGSNLKHLVQMIWQKFCFNGYFGIALVRCPHIEKEMLKGNKEKFKKLAKFIWLLSLKSPNNDAVNNKYIKTMSIKKISVLEGLACQRKIPMLCQVKQCIPLVFRTCSTTHDDGESDESTAALRTSVV